MSRSPLPIVQWFSSFFASMQGVFFFLKSMVQINTTVRCCLQGGSPHLGRIIFLFQSMVFVPKNWCCILPHSRTSLQRHRKPQPPGKYPSSFPTIELQVYIYYVFCPTWNNEKKYSLSPHIISGSNFWSFMFIVEAHLESDCRQLLFSKGKYFCYKMKLWLRYLPKLNCLAGV